MPANVSSFPAGGVEFRFTVDEIAEFLEIAPITVKREWATAKLWLQRELAYVR